MALFERDLRTVRTPEAVPAPDAGAQSSRVQLWRQARWGIRTCIYITICMCICIYIYIFVYLFVYMCPYAYTLQYTCIYVYTYAYTYTYRDPYRYRSAYYISIYIYICIYTLFYIYIYTYMCMYIYIYIYKIHRHTRTHTETHTQTHLHVYLHVHVYGVRIPHMFFNYTHRAVLPLTHMYMCTYTYIHVYLYIYTYTHIICICTQIFCRESSPTYGRPRSASPWRRRQRGSRRHVAKEWFPKCRGPCFGVCIPIPQRGLGGVGSQKGQDRSHETLIGLNSPYWALLGCLPPFCLGSFG